MLSEFHTGLINVVQQYKIKKDDPRVRMAALESMKLYFIDKMLEHPKMLEQNTFAEIVKKATEIATLYINS